MMRKNFVVCVAFSLWTIIQTSLHLVFVIYSYYLSICGTSPTQAPTIFFYLTYLYNKKCDVPSLKESSILNLESVETYILNIVKNVYSETNTINFDRIVTELLTKIDLFPDYAPESSKASVFLLCFIILDGAWIVSAVSLLMGTCFGIKQSLSLVFYGPWLVMTICVCIFDASASIAFGLDVPETINFTSWLKFVGIKDIAAFEDFDAKNPLFIIPISPTVALCSISSRFVVLWISNWIGFFYVLRATASVYKDSYKSGTHLRRHDFPDSPPGRSQLDLDTSAARIRSWQLFYGAVDTTSSQSNKSETDLNSNSRDRGGEGVEMQRVTSGDADTFYHPQPDVAEGVDMGGNACLVELRGQLPWSYIPTQEDLKRGANEERIELEGGNRRNVRLKSDSSLSGTEL